MQNVVFFVVFELLLHRFCNVFQISVARKHLFQIIVFPTTWATRSCKELSSCRAALRRNYFSGRRMCPRFFGRSARRRCQDEKVWLLLLFETSGPTRGAPDAASLQKLGFQNIALRQHALHGAGGPTSMWNATYVFMTCAQTPF